MNKNTFTVVAALISVALIQPQGVLAVAAVKKEGAHTTRAQTFKYTQSKEFEKFLEAKRAISTPKLDIGSPAEKTLELYGVEPSKALTKQLKQQSKSATTKRNIAADVGDGNNLSWSAFYYGDIAVMRNGSCSYFGYPCYWSHAAMWDSDFDYGHESDFTFWSATPKGTAPSDNGSSPYSMDGKVGVQSKASVHKYSLAQAVWVPSVPDYNDYYYTTVYAYNQRGEDYNTLTSKSSSSSWYCSKVSYRAYYVEAGKNLDYDGGYYVFPDDIYNDGDTSVFAVGL